MISEMISSDTIKGRATITTHTLLEIGRGSRRGYIEPAMLRRQKLIVQGEVTAVLSALRGGGGGGGGRWIGIGRSNSVN